MAKFCGYTTTSILSFKLEILKMATITALRQYPLVVSARLKGKPSANFPF